MSLLYNGFQQEQIVEAVCDLFLPCAYPVIRIIVKAHVIQGDDMLRQHPGKGALRRGMLQGCRRLKSPQPVRIVPGIFLRFLLQCVGTEPHLRVKYGIDFLLCDMASLL